MARKPRIQYGGAIYHVMSRGDRREAIFGDDRDRQRLVQTLGEACQKTGWQVPAYADVRDRLLHPFTPPRSRIVRRKCCQLPGWAYRERNMSIAEVRQLPLAEKLQIMEAIWEDLRAHVEQVAVPQWHRDLLDERRKAVEEGRERLLDWDSIKDSLPSRRKA